jgi:hypothetical protein
MVLIGTAALTVDVGRINSERRQLQNGADAVALSVAKDCVKAGNCLPGGTVNPTILAGDNAQDGFTKIGRKWDDAPAICGAGPGLLACPPLQPGLSDCLEPAGGMPDEWVRAYTTTQDGADATKTLLPYSFGQLLTGGQDGKQVQACAQAAIGPGLPPKVAPIVQAQCAWDYATKNGTSFPAKPPYSPPTLPATVDQVTMIRLQSPGSSADGTKCSASGPGHYAPGNFGWLDANGDCEETLVSDVGTVSGKSGLGAPPGCDWKDDVEKWVGQTLYIPIFTTAVGNGSKTDYTISGVSAFYVAGVSINSAENWVGKGTAQAFDPKNPSLWANGEAHACYKNAKYPADDPSTPGDESKDFIGSCMWGWFLDPVLPIGEIGKGADRGVSVIGLLG